MYKLNEKEETLIKKFESISFGIDDSLLRTIFFKKSWLGINDLEYNNFLLKLEQLKEMFLIKEDVEADNRSKIAFAFVPTNKLLYHFVPTAPEREIRLNASSKSSTIKILW